MMYVLYIVMFVIANFLVLKFGKIGVLLASSIFIPFDFVIRCYFQEKWVGKALMLRIGSLILVSSIISYFVNYDLKNIAIASFFSFLSSQIIATILYQLLKEREYFIKVNGSDLFAIITDSIIFQSIAFGSIVWKITVGQILIKFIGGFIWYLILFQLLKIQKKWST